MEEYGPMGGAINRNNTSLLVHTELEPRVTHHCYCVCDYVPSRIV